MASIYKKALEQKLRPRSSRLSLPKVNTDPRPPNEAKASTQGVDNQSKSLTVTTPTSAATRGGGVAVKPPGTQPATTLPSGAPFIPPPSYYADLAALQASASSQLGQLNVEGTYAQTNYERALQRLALQEPRDVLSTREGANKAGAFYSSNTTEKLGQIAQNYFFARADLESDFNRDKALRAVIRQGIQSGLSAQQAALLAQAVEEAALNELNRPGPTVPPIDIAAILGSAGGGGGAGNSGGGAGNNGGGNRPKQPGPNFRWNGSHWIKQPGPNYIWNAQKKKWIKK